MALIRDFVVDTGSVNETVLNWVAPIGINGTDDEVIVTRTITHFPTELFNSSFPTKATDSRPTEIFRGSSIAGTDTGTISVATNILTDTSASFPLAPKLIGRLVRDSASKVIRILDNTATTLTLDDAPTDGKYIVLPDFNKCIRPQENYELDIRTESGQGFIKNLVIIEASSLNIKNYEEDELANLIFIDGSSTKLIIKSNTSDTIFFYENTTTPVIGANMAVLNSFVDSSPLPYVDQFSTESEAAARVGNGLADNTFYYYTGFTKDATANVAQAEFSSVDSGTPTQAAAISTKDNDFGGLLFREYWPSLYQDLDKTGDLEDLMSVFGFQLNQIYSLIDTYNLQDTQTVYVNALLPLSEQFGLPAVGFSIGIDTLRRIAKDLIGCWKLKGSKEGIALFIKKITTWDITNGTADYSEAIQDFLPNIEALRFYSVNLGITNNRITASDPLFVPGGRFVQGLPGVVIPGFFSFREFVITVPDVALYVGDTEDFSVSGNQTTMTDNAAIFGADNSLVGNFLLPNQEEVNDVFEIVANTSTTITVKGIITNRSPGGDFAIFSPLNANRFAILNRLLPLYIPFGTLAGFIFV